MLVAILALTLGIAVNAALLHHVHTIPRHRDDTAAIDAQTRCEEASFDARLPGILPLRGAPAHDLGAPRVLLFGLVLSILLIAAADATASRASDRRLLAYRDALRSPLTRARARTGR